MSRHEKLLAKFLDRQSRCTWQELVTLLNGFGYCRVEGQGSRVKFDNGDPQALINLHRPHPGNDIKAYAKRQVIENLKSGGLIK